MPVTKDFKNLKSWQISMYIAEQCYFMTRRFPPGEIMAELIVKSAASIPANIAQGYTTHIVSEDIKLLFNVQGLVNELETYILLSERVGLCPRNEWFQEIFSLLEELREMIRGQIEKLKR